MSFTNNYLNEDIDILTNGFKLFNINEYEYIEKKIKDNNNKINNASKAYFNILKLKAITNEIYINCNCGTNHYFIIDNYCTNGKLHEIYQIPNEYLNKNILYYSYNDFIKQKPFLIN
jgi:hypothetical protein